MEPEDNLMYATLLAVSSGACLPQSYSEGAQEAVEEYYHELGGRPEKPTKKRKSAGEAKATLEEAERKRRRRPKGAAGTETPEGDEIGSWVPKGKSWENDVASVDTVCRESSGNLYAYLVWTNGKKSKVSTELCSRKCPMKASLLSWRSCDFNTDLELVAQILRGSSVCVLVEDSLYVVTNGYLECSKMVMVESLPSLLSKPLTQPALLNSPLASWPQFRLFVLRIVAHGLGWFGLRPPAAFSVT